MRRILLGSACLFAGCTLALTTQGLELSSWWYVYSLLAQRPEGIYHMIWRPVLIIVLFGVGTDLLVIQYTGRPENRGRSRLLMLCGLWAILYLLYIATLAAHGQAFALDQFEFAKPAHLVLLYMLSVLPFLVVRLALRSDTLADVWFAWAGFYGSFLTRAPCALWGPKGCPIDHPLQAMHFIGIPMLVLGFIGIVAMLAKLVRQILSIGPRLASPVLGDADAQA